MNLDLLILLIILYIIKNNNENHLYHTRTQNQNLSLSLAPINERKLFSNNKYTHTNLINNRDINYTYYHNRPSKNFNSIKNTSINTNKNTIIKSDNPINVIADKDITINNENSTITNTIKDTNDHINKVNSINTNKNSIVNYAKCTSINENNTSSINTNKHTNIKKYNTLNTITDKNIINNSNTTTTTTSNHIKNTSKINSINNKDNIINYNNTISNTKNFRKNISKNKFIRYSTKIFNKSLTYNNLYKKDYKININNTFKQLQLSQSEINKDEFIKNLNLPIPNPVTKFKTKVPVLIGSTNITEVFHGTINFNTPIISILKVTNELFITNKRLLPTLNCNNNNSTLYYEGFLKIQLEYLKHVSIEEFELSAVSKYYVLCVPFSGSKSFNLNDDIINSSNIIPQDFTLDINKSTFSIDNHLEEPIKGNKYINLYKLCNLTVKVDCHISLYRKKLVQL